MEATTEQSKDNVVYAAASAIGILAGVRSMIAPAIVTRMASQCSSVPKEAFGIFGNGTAQKVMSVAAVGEMVADKLPFMPNRTDAPSLAVRIAVGAFCGAAICGAFGRSKSNGAIAGAFGALGGTFAAFHLRRALAGTIPDAAVALIEDTTAIWGGKVLCERLS